jgi:cytochrome P450
MEALDMNPFDPDVLSRPHSYWSTLRSDDPVRRIDFPATDRPTFLVSRKLDVQAVAADPATYSSEAPSDIMRWGDLGPVLQPLLVAKGWPIVHTIASADPPIHTVYRKLVMPMFSPKRVNQLAEQIQDSIDQLLAAIPSDEPFDFMSGFAIPLPIRMIVDLLGLPRSESDLVYQFTDVFVKMVDPTSSGKQAEQAVLEFAKGQQHLAAYIRKFEANPSDVLLSHVANATHDDGRRYSMEERLSLAYLLVAAGNETTRNGLAHCAYYLARDPEIWTRLKADRSLVSVFVEEALRLGTPASLNPRLVTRDTQLGGVSIPAGAVVFMLWGSANRDEQAFTNAERIDLDRASPRSHFAFGYGIHTCVGAPLARRELNLSVEAWLDRFSAWNFAFPLEEIVHEPLFGFRTFHELPIIAAS